MIININDFNRMVNRPESKDLSPDDFSESTLGYIKFMLESYSRGRMIIDDAQIDFARKYSNWYDHDTGQLLTLEEAKARYKSAQNEELNNGQ